jgi:flagellin-like protein
MSDPPDRRAVSPTIGVVLLVAIVVVLAGVSGVVFASIDMPDREKPTPLTHDADYTADGADNGGRPYVEITVTGGRERLGDETYIVDSEGNRVQWSAVWTAGEVVTAGEYVHIDGHGSDGALATPCHGVEYRVIRYAEDGEGRVLIHTEITEYAEGPATSYC